MRLPEAMAAAALAFMVIEAHCELMLIVEETKSRNSYT
jgi:hypothetical protein